MSYPNTLACRIKHVLRWYSRICNAVWNIKRRSLIMKLVAGESKQHVSFILKWLPGLFWHDREVERKPWLQETTQQLIGGLLYKKSLSWEQTLSLDVWATIPRMETQDSSSVPQVHPSSPSTGNQASRNSHLGGKSHWYHSTDVFRSLLDFSHL